MARFIPTILVQATLLALTKAIGFLGGPPLHVPMMPMAMRMPMPMAMAMSMPLPMIRPLIHPIGLPLVPFGGFRPPMMPPRAPRTTTTTAETKIRSVPFMPFGDSQQDDVLVVINDRDCFNGLCQNDVGLGNAGYIDGIDYMAGGLNNPPVSNFHFHDADNIYLGNGQF